VNEGCGDGFAKWSSRGFGKRYDTQRLLLPTRVTDLQSALF
jgi:hypothetical protein